MLLGRQLRRVKASLSSRCRCSGVPVSCILITLSLMFLIFKLLFTEGQQLRYCGVGAGYEDIIIDGSLDDLKV